MNITVQGDNALAVVTVEGQIDSGSAPEAQQEILPVIREHSGVVMDLSGLTFMSSAGLRMMLLLYREATSRGGKLALVGLADSIRDTMDVTGFLTFFDVCDSLDEARQAVQP